jgi:hypothetical protein
VPARKRQRKLTHVTANLPTSVELTKLNSKNSMTIQIRTGDTLLGTIVMGRGSVQWWPSGNSVNALRRSWVSFARMLGEHM